MVRNIIKQNVGNSEFFSNLKKMGRKLLFSKNKRKEFLKGSRLDKLIQGVLTHILSTHSKS